MVSSKRFRPSSCRTNRIEKPPYRVFIRAEALDIGSLPPAACLDQGLRHRKWILEPPGIGNDMDKLREHGSGKRKMITPAL